MAPPPLFLLSSQSTVLAAVESQFLVFFKSCPELAQQAAPPTLQYLLVLTYVALIFGVSATISSLVLTRNFGNVPRLVERLRERINGTGTDMRQGFEISPTKLNNGQGLAPRRWRLIELHCEYYYDAPETCGQPHSLALLQVLFTLIASMLCLPAQIFLYIWMFEKTFIRATVSVAGVFSMLPLLHFLPIPSRSMRNNPKLTIPLFHRDNSETYRLGDDIMLPAPMSHPPLTYTARPASQNIA